MTPERWQQVKGVLQEAMELAPEQRRAFLERACSTDHSLRREVESLLSSSNDVRSSFMQSSSNAGLRLSKGTRLGDFEILSLLGSGGMGEVYRARDRRLEREVAIKVLPRFLSFDPERLHRFEQEAKAAAALNHPNILAVFHMGSYEGAPYLVSELLEGETLREQVKHGPMPLKKAIDYGVQIVHGLAAAHEKGIVHRDLKPENLFVTRDCRIKILDFGLAKLTHPDAETQVTEQTLDTEPGAVLGTMGYMSPEQVRGLVADHRADIFAFGVILYEMLSGKPAFHKPTSAETMSAILNEDPPALSQVVPKLPPALQGVMRRCMEKNPEQRFQSASDIVSVLPASIETQPHAPESILQGRKTSLRAAFAVGTLLAFSVLIVGLNVGGLRNRLFHTNAPSLASSATAGSAPIRMRRSVAVLGFKNLSGRADEAWLSTALSEMLTSELAAGGKLRTIPGEDIAQMKVNLSLPDAESYGKETLSRIRKNLGSDEVILGSYLAQGNGEVRLDLKLEDATTGEIVDSLTQIGKEAELATLVSRTGNGLREKLGAGEISAAEAAAVKATLPANPEAARFYSEGLKKVRTHEGLAARDLLQRAVAAEPNFALAHTALAYTWKGLGYDEKAKEESKKAFDMSANLSKEDRLWVEARYRRNTHEWGKAVEILRMLFDFFPDNLEYGLSLAGAQLSSGKAQDAQVTVEAMRRLPPPARDDPRIDLVEAWAAYRIGDPTRAQVALERAAKKAESQGAKLLFAEALGGECDSLQVQAMSHCEQAQRLYAEAGDRNAVARVLNAIAEALRDAGDLEGAKPRTEEALSVFRQVGDKAGEAHALWIKGTILESQGDLARAKMLYEQVQRINLDIGDKHDWASDFGNIGETVIFQGDLVNGLRLCERSAKILHEQGDKSWSYEPDALRRVAMGLYYEGNLNGAKEMLGKAQSILSEISDKRVSSLSHFYLGEVFRTEGNLAGARAEYQESLRLRQDLAQKGSVAQAMVALADLSVEEEQPQDAQALIQRALAELRTEKLADDQIRGEVVLAQALLLQGKAAEAQKELDSVRAMAGRSQNRDVRLITAIIAARVSAALGKYSLAETNLRTTLAEATKYGFVGRQFESRLALGDVEMKSGQVPAGRVRLAALEKDATSKGFLLIAHKAHAAANAS